MVAIAAVEVPRAFLPALSVSSRPMARSSPQVAALDRVFADERVQELLRADWMAGIPEDRVPPGNRWCKRCDGGPRCCCLCPCHGCGLRGSNCSCEVGDYTLHPFLASWDSPWHTTGYRRDFVQGVRDLTEALRSIVDVDFAEMMEASPVAALLPPTGAGRCWSFAAGICSTRSNSGTRTSRNLSPTWNSDEGTLLPELVGPELGHVEVRNLCGKVSEFLHLSGERLFTVPSSAATFVIHGMLRDHLHLPMSCLALFPVAEGLGAGVEPCSYHVIPKP